MKNDLFKYYFNVDLNMQNSEHAQGTIEYLIVVAVIAVLSLVVITIASGIFSSPSQSISSSSSKIGEVAVGGISVVESVVDSEGDSLIKLSNNSSDAITLTKISAGGVDGNYSEQLVGLDSKIFSLNGVSSACPCEDNQKSAKCEFKIEYITSTGIVSTEYKTINVECVDDSSATDSSKVIDPIDLSLSAVSLSSPSGSVSSRIIDFVFDLTKANKIASCTLNAGNDSNIYSGFVDGSNTIRYTFSSDRAVDWNLTCVDTKSNVIQSSSLTLNVDANAYQITTCTELEGLNDYSGDYELMNDINCGSISNFSPIAGAVTCSWGSCQPVNLFSGTFDGKNYSINNLTINSSSPFSGLFGAVYLGNIKNLSISGISLTCSGSIGNNGCGAVAGEFSGIANQLAVTGTITASGAWTGGIIGSNTYDAAFGRNKLLNSSFNGSIYSNGESDVAITGGLVGLSTALDINNSTSAGVIYNLSGGPADQYAVDMYTDLTVSNSASTLIIQ